MASHTRSELRAAARTLAAAVGQDARAAAQPAGVYDGFAEAA